MPDRKRIELEQALTNKAAEVLSGFDRGTYYRKHFALSEKDSDDAQYEIVVPERMAAMNLSFFLSMFGESITKLGEEGFQSKYSFNAASPIKRTVEQGISRVLRQKKLMRA